MTSPITRWPPYGVPYESDGPGPLLNHQIFGDAHFHGFHPDHTSTCDSGADPSSVALASASATPAPEHEFKMIVANGAMEGPVADSHF